MSMLGDAGPLTESDAALPPFLRGTGEMGSLVAAHEWGATPLGPIGSWDPTLKSAVAMVLSAEPAMALLWGATGTLIYNSGYAVVSGRRHPAILGTAVVDAWPEAADFNRNVLDVCLAGRRLAFRDTHLVLMRNGIAEDAWFDLNYSPIRDGDGNTVAVFALVTETTARHAAEESLRQGRERFGHALDAAGVIGVWEWNIESGLVSTDARLAEFLRIDRDRALAGVLRDEFTQNVHPEDRAHIDEQLQLSIDAGADLSLDYRVADKDGRNRWVMVRGTCINGASGKPERFSGAAVEITKLKNAEEARRLLIRELHHRIKNTFAVIAGMVTMTARSAADVDEMAEVLRGRLVALAAAHELIRPAITAEIGHTEQTTLADLFTAILTPHLYFPEQFSLDAPPIEIGVTAATSLALVLHELATNAAKYGALSTAKGRLAVTARLAGSMLELAWVESGGPSVAGPPPHQGFGSRLATMSVVGQLAGSIDFEWNESGLVARLAMSRDRLAR